jgi:predicted metal-dependent hydrolase
MNDHYYIDYGTEKIQFKLVFCQRKNIEIAVMPDCCIEVKAPDHTCIELVKDRVKKRSPWILKKIRDFKKFHPLQPPRKYVSGETHLYLGKKYRIKLNESPTKDVKFLRGRFIIELPDRDDSANVKKLLYAWYRKRAILVFQERHELLLKRLVELEVPEHKLVIQKMHKRWGSCFGDKIILNLELIKAEKYEIDYVIAHELCHLFERNHDKNYYRLLSTVFPEWPAVKEKLNYKGIYVD